jgi:hypothetical protein
MFYFVVVAVAFGVVTGVQKHGIADWELGISDHVGAVLLSLVWPLSLLGYGIAVLLMLLYWIGLQLSGYVLKVETFMGSLFM